MSDLLIVIAVVFLCLLAVLLRSINHRLLIVGSVLFVSCSSSDSAFVFLLVIVRCFLNDCSSFSLLCSFSFLLLVSLVFFIYGQFGSDFSERGPGRKLIGSAIFDFFRLFLAFWVPQAPLEQSYRGEILSEPTVAQQNEEH